jgi:hypothetical protein
MGCIEERRSWVARELAGRGRTAPRGFQDAPSGAEIFSIALPTVKLAAFCRGGNSLKVSSSLATKGCAGRIR